MRHLLAPDAVRAAHVSVLAGKGYSQLAACRRRPTPGRTLSASMCSSCLTVSASSVLRQSVCSPQRRARRESAPLGALTYALPIAPPPPSESCRDHPG